MGDSRQSEIIVDIKEIWGLKKPFSVIIPKKFSQKATKRNLIRRRIKAIVAPLLKSKAFSLKIIIRSDVGDLSYTDLKSGIERKIKKYI